MIHGYKTPERSGLNYIEIVIGIIFLVTLVLVGRAFLGNQNNLTYGVNGVTESQCIENYKFVVGQDGNPRQILDEFGKGVRCNRE